ncbi:MAG TPA: hypothetical protein VEI07_21745, partial [Planctomycetaceae bacterium]|nr:hypothetical protein [Planctomycetaceae bacterium]
AIRPILRPLKLTRCTGLAAHDPVLLCGNMLRPCLVDERKDIFESRSAERSFLGPAYWWPSAAARTARAKKVA